MPGHTTGGPSWTLTEPVRLYVYGVVVTVLVLAGGYGLVAGNALPLWLALAQAALAIPAAEAARTKVTSPATRLAMAAEIRDLATQNLTAWGHAPSLTRVADRLENI